MEPVALQLSGTTAPLDIQPRKVEGRTMVEDMEGPGMEADAVRFPNTIKRRSDSSPQYNAAASASSSASAHKTPKAPQTQATGGDELGTVDVDTCRICRGEATSNEPLFYPCKCSGSIRYVHQDCLMEWLSHSQKKHCELCKTAFRFTKLYSPDMPNKLPFYVFLSHMAKYLMRNVLVWMRFGLVLSVWLVGLPYLMRIVWSCLFWISDIGFTGFASPSSRLASYAPSQGSFTATQVERLAGRLRSPAGPEQGLTTMVCPSTPLLPVTTSTANMASITHAKEQRPGIWLGLSPNTTSIFPLQWFTRQITNLLLGRPSVGPDTATEVSAQAARLAQQIATDQAPQVAHGSLLSDVYFLNHLTSHESLNRVIIKVIEGQIITVLVILSFVLIILVRDYVVQQQPEINMRNAFQQQENAVDAFEPPVRVIEHPNNEPVEREELRVADHPNVEGEQDDNDSMIVQFHNMEPNEHERPRRDNAVEQGELGERRIAVFRRRIPGRDPNTAATADAGIAADVPLQVEGGGEASDQPASSGSQHGGGTLMEQLRIGSGSTDEFLARLSIDADGNRDEMLRTINDEGTDKLPPGWVAGLKSGAADLEARDDKGKNKAANDPNDAREYLEPRHVPGSAQYAGGNRDQLVGSSAVPWGNPENRWAQPAWAAPVPLPSSSYPTARPRAVSDGPQRHETINPLANHSWDLAGPIELVSLSAAETRAQAQAQAQAHAHDAVQDMVQEGAADPNSCPPESLLESEAGLALPMGDRQIEEALTNNGTDNGTDNGTENGIDDRTDNSDGGQSGQLLADQHLLPERATNAEDQTTAPLDQEPVSLVERVVEFMWGDVQAGDEEQVQPDAMEIFFDNPHGPMVLLGRDEEDDTEDDDDDDPFGDHDGADAEVGPEADGVAVAAPLDPDAMEAFEDAEDFEGIMELFGMRGPLLGLLQNAVFCALLVSSTIFLGINVPYNFGRMFVWVVANPMRIIRIVFSFSKLVQDLVLLAVGCTAQVILTAASAACRMLGVIQGQEILRNAVLESRKLAFSSLGRVRDVFVPDPAMAPACAPFVMGCEIRDFSAVSHEALIFLKGQIRGSLSLVGSAIEYLSGGDYMAKWYQGRSVLSSAVPHAWSAALNMVSRMAEPSSWMIDLSVPEGSASIPVELASWDVKDRTLAVVCGYLSTSLLAALYLGRGTPFSSSQTAQEWEASIIDALHQASGVMKVILIISIEMLIFPLYCGMLLDFALLPLFEGTTFKSRLLFTYNYPLTSVFVHWFVGTGYMFHFALFVSMCRKIMRKGVLCRCRFLEVLLDRGANYLLTWPDFIRDPDDPEFHPVRDVLERNVTAQLRKILFSGFVYGTLVVVCLGGVVWGLSLSMPDVLPIHYSSNEPVLEFPIDLLFYNFLMPLAVKLLKPGDGLHVMYTWWFRCCARALRLTCFLFGERHIDEEGSLRLLPSSPYQATPWYRKLFLVLDMEEGEVVPITWTHLLNGPQRRVPPTRMHESEMRLVQAAKEALTATGQIIPSGRFVRTPASDHVKITKGESVFVEVAENDWNAVNDNRNYQLAYVPPSFPLRISLFILFIWFFAAVTGLSMTIVPLVLGRRLFKMLVPNHIRTNDIYAFSIGISVMGSQVYLMLHSRSIAAKVDTWLQAGARNVMTARDGLERALVVARVGAKLCYTYSMLLVVFPLLLTVLMELYVLMPVHTWLYPPQPPGGDARFGGHTIRVIQAWTLGILYQKLGSRALASYGGRPAAAVRAILRRGWLKPDTSVLTRAFVIPLLLSSALLIFIPPICTCILLKTGWLYGHLDMGDVGVQITVYRASYPAMAVIMLFGALTRMVRKMTDGWKARVRDEAYLMGERLHNFGGLVVGDRNAKFGAGSLANGEWRGGARL